jgi:norsolorinic acid ketoreductase
VAAVRSSAAAESLRSLPKSSGSHLIVIEIDVASPDIIKRGIESLTTDYELSSLDIVIANAGMAVKSPKLIEMATHDIQPFIDVNAYGQLELFKAVLPLLRRSTNKAKGKFMYMSSVGGSLTTMNNMLPMSAYGASKALGNFFVKWLSLEQQHVVIWAQHPG